MNCTGVLDEQSGRWLFAHVLGKVRLLHNVSVVAAPTVRNLHGNLADSQGAHFYASIAKKCAKFIGVKNGS